MTIEAARGATGHGDYRPRHPWLHAEGARLSLEEAVTLALTDPEDESGRTFPARRPDLMQPEAEAG